jgi:hypothetical protein
MECGGGTAYLYPWFWRGLLQGAKRIQGVQDRNAPVLRKWWIEIEWAVRRCWGRKSKRMVQATPTAGKVAFDSAGVVQID